MADDTVVLIDVQVEDNSSTDITNITNNVVHLHQAVQQEEKQENKWAASLKRISKASLTAARAVAKVAASVAAVASVTGPAVAGLLAAGKAVAAFGTSLANLTPLIAFVPSLIGSFVLLKQTAKLMGPGFAKAFEPIMRNFVNADGSASRFTQRLQNIAQIGLKPLAAQFNKVNIPAIQKGMEGIAYHLNSITAHTLMWLNTTPGQQLISNITVGTAKAMQSLFPHVIRLVNAFGGLAAKAGDKAIVNLADVIGRLLDKISTWAEQHDLDDINAALKDLSGYGGRLKDTFTVVRDIGRWMAENKDKVKAFSDAAAGGAIALGVATGNIPAILAGSFSLIVNHWDKVKELFKGATPIVKDLFDRWKNDSNRIAIAEGVQKSLRKFVDGFREYIPEIQEKWSKFVSSLKKAWETWGPILAAWWDQVGSRVFRFLGEAAGTFLVNFLLVLDGVTKAVDLIGQAIKKIVPIILGVFGTIINGAASAFGWVPGIGPKLQEAAKKFNAFADEVNRALNRIDPIKTVRINASVYVTGNNSAAGGVDQRTGNSRNAGLSGLASWQAAAAAAFAGDRGGSRTGGPTALHAEVSNVIMLDGRPFREYTDRVLLASERRRDWRAKTGRR